MEPWETFTGKVMKQSNVQMRLLMRAKPSEVEPKGRGHEKIDMKLSTQRHGTLYKYEEISHMYQEAQGSRIHK
jgi:hypothetical protein